MTDPQVAVFMLAMFIVLIMLGFPIAFTLMGMGIGFGYYAYFEWARCRADGRELRRRRARHLRHGPEPGPRR